MSIKEILLQFRILRILRSNLLEDVKFEKLLASVSRASNHLDLNGLIKTCDQCLGILTWLGRSVADE